MDVVQLEHLANDMRIEIVSMIAEAGSGHPGGSLSCIDIVTALYFGGVMDYRVEEPDWEQRDRFVLAKGHAAPALYAALAHAGYFPVEELMTLRKLNTRLQGHPDCRRLPGIEVSTGSLGQGLSIACGMACGLRLNGTGSTVFTLLGDGECEEGQVWEAAMFAVHQRLDNLVAIVDNNHLQIDGSITDVSSKDNFGELFAAFGWNVARVNGHDIAALLGVLNEAKASRNGLPTCIIAETVKGKGVSFMENEAGWHGKAPKPDEAVRALEELKTR